MKLAGVLNIVVGTSTLIFTKQSAQLFHGRGYQFANLEQEIYFRALFGFVLLFGFIYLWVARETQRYSGIIVLSALGKLSFYGFTTFLYLYNRLTMTGLTAASLNDLLMAGLFLWIASTSPEKVSENENSRTSLKESEDPQWKNITDRVKPATGWSVDTLRWITERRFGQPLENLRVIGHHGWLLFGLTMAETAFDNFDGISNRLQSLISLRVAQIVGCPW